jgi:hypothetical protein
MLNSAWKIVTTTVMSGLLVAAATPSQAQWSGPGWGWGAQPAYASFCWGYARPSYYNPGWVYIAPLPPAGSFLPLCDQTYRQARYVGRRAYRATSRP